MRKILVMAVVFTTLIWATVIPPKTEITVTGVLAFQNRCTSVIYWDKKTVDVDDCFTTNSHEKELGMGGVDIHFLNTSSKPCRVKVDK